MRRDVLRFGFAKGKRPEPIEKTPRAHKSLLANGQRSYDFQCTDTGFMRGKSLEN